MAPAMHTEMWEHTATQANVVTLTERGVHVIRRLRPLTGADTGPGRLPAGGAYAVCERMLAHRHFAPGRPPPARGIQEDAVAAALPLAGRRVVVSAGGTREPLDPVRFLGNRSSGKQGYALATVAAQRGAEVILVSANADLPAPSGVTVVPGNTATEMREAVLDAGKSADVVVMAAAVADFRPAEYAAARSRRATTLLTRTLRPPSP